MKVKKHDENKIYFTAKGKGLHSNSVVFGTSNGDELMENKNNNSFSAIMIPHNNTVNGMIRNPGEEDWYVVEGKKGENMVIEILAHRLGSLLDADLTLYDSKSNVLAQADDFEDRSEGLETFHADPRMVYKFAKNENVFIRVRDVMGKGGKAYGYRLFTGKPQPDFDLRIKPSNLIINQAGTTSFTVFALRKFNFMGAISLNLKGLPPGYSHSYDVIKNGQNQITMTLTAPKDAKLGPLDLKISGKSETNGSVVERKAEPVEEEMQAFFYKHLLPTGDFLTTVVPPLPFSISHAIPADSTVVFSKGTGFTFRVKVNRSADFNLPVQLILDNPSKGVVRMKPVIVPAGESEATVTFELAGNVFNQNLNLVVSGIARVQKSKKTKAKVYKALSTALVVETPKRNFKNSIPR